MSLQRHNHIKIFSLSLLVSCTSEWESNSLLFYLFRKSVLPASSLGDAWEYSDNIFFKNKKLYIFRTSSFSPCQNNWHQKCSFSLAYVPVGIIECITNSFLMILSPFWQGSRHLASAAIQGVVMIAICLCMHWNSLSDILTYFEISEKVCPLFPPLQIYCI